MVGFDHFHEVVLQGETPETEWFNGPVPAAIPDAGETGPAVITTMNRARLDGNDHFIGGYGMRTDDLGDTWTEPTPYDGLDTREVDHPEFGEVWRAAYDLWPRWHEKSETVMATGNSILFDEEGIVSTEQAGTVPVTAYDPAADEWTEWDTIVDETGLSRDLSIDWMGAGYVQWTDRPDGTVLLPVAIKRSDWQHKVTVLECSFDGTTLTAQSYGDIIESLEDVTRGLAEPSLTRYNGSYYLTIRSDERGYVTKSDNGLHYEPLKEWRFDSDLFLGNYNTQQHWVTHSDGLFLVYTRLGLGSGHNFRSRGPIVMGQVDPETLRVQRETEQVIIPDRGYRMGCFGVTNVTPEETWVMSNPFIQHKDVQWRKEKLRENPADGSVHLARIRWNEPNERQL